MARKASKSRAKRVVQSTRRSHQGQLKMTSFSQLVLATVVFWLGNTLVLLLVNELIPGMLVLGTHLISPLMAAVYAGGVIALVGVSATPIIEFVAVQQRIRLTSMHWMMLYFVINAGVIWLVSRFAELVGMGIGAWWVALVLGLIFDVTQGLLMKYVVSGSEA